jgi:hypothetical protein
MLVKVSSCFVKHSHPGRRHFWLRLRLLSSLFATFLIYHQTTASSRVKHVINLHAYAVSRYVQYPEEIVTPFAITISCRILTLLMNASFDLGLYPEWCHLRHCRPLLNGCLLPPLIDIDFTSTPPRQNCFDHHKHKRSVEFILFEPILYNLFLTALSLLLLFWPHAKKMHEAQCDLQQVNLKFICT